MKDSDFESRQRHGEINQPFRQGGMRKVVVRFDHWLSDQLGVFAFNQDRQCIIRLQYTHAPHDMLIRDIFIKKQSPVLGLHLHNDHMPDLGLDSRNLSWAARTQRQYHRSLHLVADFIREHSLFPNYSAIYGVSVLLSEYGQTWGSELIPHLGFTVYPYHNPLSLIGEFWENLFTYTLMWAYNPVSLRWRTLFSLKRFEI